MLQLLSGILSTFSPATRNSVYLFKNFCRADSEKNHPGFGKQVREETSPYPLLGAQDQRLGAEKDQLPCGSTVLATVKKRKLAWFGHVTRHDSLSKTILQGTLKGGRRHGRQRKCWMGNIKNWTSLSKPELFTRASCRKGRKRISAESSLMPAPSPPSPRRPNRSRN